MPLAIAKPILFGTFTVTSQVFHLTKHSFAFVNLKPILPGHVLVSPLRRAPRLRDLSPVEVADLFLCVQNVGRMLERVFHATALNVAIQDGSDAGQSVPHVHAHIIPRKPADLPNTDDIYTKIDGPEGDLGSYLNQRVEMPQRGEMNSKRASLVVDTDEARQPRSEAEMVKEAEWLAKEMEKQ